MEKKEFLEFIGDKILLNDFEIIKLSDFIKGCDKRDSKMLQDIAELVLCFNRPNAKMLFSAILTIIEGKVKQSVEKSALSNFQGSK